MQYVDASFDNLTLHSQQQLQLLESSDFKESDSPAAASAAAAFSPKRMKTVDKDACLILSKVKQVIFKGDTLVEGMQPNQENCIWNLLTNKNPCFPDVIDAAIQIAQLFPRVKKRFNLSGLVYNNSLGSNLIFSISGSDVLSEKEALKFPTKLIRPLVEILGASKIEEKKASIFENRIGIIRGIGQTALSSFNVGSEPQTESRKGGWFCSEGKLATETSKILSNQPDTYIVGVIHLAVEEIDDEIHLYRQRSCDECIHRLSKKMLVNFSSEEVMEAQSPIKPSPLRTIRIRSAQKITAKVHESIVEKKSPQAKRKLSTVIEPPMVVDHLLSQQGERYRELAVQIVQKYLDQGKE